MVSPRSFAGVPAASERAIDADQTNHSVVVGERAIVKWFRTVGPGPSRAPVPLAHLDAVGFPEMPAPLGSLASRRPDGPDLTIAQGNAFLPGAVDGWDWCLARLERHIAHGDTPCPPDCDPWIGARSAGWSPRLHAALRTPSLVIRDSRSAAPRRTSFAAGGPPRERTLDEAIALPSAADDHGCSWRGSRADARPTWTACRLIERIEDRGRSTAISTSGRSSSGRAGCSVIDFDGNPALGPRRECHPPARRTGHRPDGLEPRSPRPDRRPPHGRRADREIVDEWIARTRRDFLGDIRRRSRAPCRLEVEQECRELVYAARFLPRWRYAPLATLRARYGG